MKKIELVPEWKQCWKWLSMNCMAIALAVQGGWVAVPEDMRNAIPHQIANGVTIALLVFGIVGRLVKQGKSK